MSAPLLFTFAAGTAGDWRIIRIHAVRGAALPVAERLAVLEGARVSVPVETVWLLRGVTSNTRYTILAEDKALAVSQPELGRPEATQAALIPIRKADEWWSLAQDERRTIFEERSRHITIGLKYLPGVARRLHHSHDLGEPFDFLTWFEYVPGYAEAFEELVGRLRETEEWSYVEREVDIRLTRDSVPRSK